MFPFLTRQNKTKCLIHICFYQTISIAIDDAVIIYSTVYYSIGILFLRTRSYTLVLCAYYIYFFFSFAPTKYDKDFYPAKTPRVLIISYLPNIYYFLYLHLIFLSSTLVSAVSPFYAFPLPLIAKCCQLFFHRSSLLILLFYNNIITLCRGWHPYPVCTDDDRVEKEKEKQSCPIQIIQVINTGRLPPAPNTGLPARVNGVFFLQCFPVTSLRRARTRSRQICGNSSTSPIQTLSMKLL